MNAPSSLDVDARLVGPLSLDRYLDRGDELPGGGALNMAYHWAQRGIRAEMISRIGADCAAPFTGFLERHRIAHTPSLIQPGPACTVDVRFADDRQPVMDNFVEGVLADIELTDDEVDAIVDGTPAHFVLVDVFDQALHRIAADRSVVTARLSGDFLSFRHFTVDRFRASMRHLEVGFVGWPASPDDDVVSELARCATEIGNVLVITFGADGVRVIDARGATGSDRWFEITAVPVHGTTVGCGDAFIAAFLDRWYRSGDVTTSVAAGSELGAAATGWEGPLPDDAYRASSV